MEVVGSIVFGEGRRDWGCVSGGSREEARRVILGVLSFSCNVL